MRYKALYMPSNSNLNLENITILNKIYTGLLKNTKYSSKMSRF
jgi:hypothetical protein